LVHEDPQSANSDVKSLLRNDNAITVEHMMGVTVTAPEPYISADPLQPFDALAAMSVDVYADEDLYKPTLPSFVTASNLQWAPGPLADDANKKTAPWDAVKKAWQDPIDVIDDSDVSVAVSAWAKALGWSTVPPSQLPTQLLLDLETLYLDAPFVGQV
jgi:hypothetical protein